MSEPRGGATRRHGPLRSGRARGWRRYPRSAGMVALSAAGALLAGALAGLTGPASSPAAALTPPVTITADELPTWQTNGIVHALAEADGVVFVGGTFSAIRPPGAEPGAEERPVANFAALDAATGEPVDCDLSFTVGSGTATVRALAVSPDQRTLYVGGTFGSVNGSGASSIAAFDLPSCERKSFPAGASGMVADIAATEDRVYLAGHFTQIDGEPRRRFAALDTAGALQGWRADADEVGKAVAVTPDGAHVVLGGDFFTVNGADSHALAIVDAADGANARTYPLGFIEAASTVQDIAVDEHGIYTGSEGSGSGVFDGRIALDLETFDERWRDTCLGATQAVLPHREVLYSGHHAHNCASMGEFPNQERYHLFAQSVHDPQLLGWFPNTNDGLGEALGPRALAVSTDHPSDDRDFLWVGGGFTTVNGQPQWGLTRFPSAPDVGDPATPEAHVSSTRPGELDLAWRSSVDLDDSLLTYHVYRNDEEEPVHEVEASSLPWRRPQLTYTDTDVAVGETHSYRVTATDGAGNVSARSAPVSATVAGSTQPYVEEVLADEPLLYWRFDEPAHNFATDHSGNGANGVHRGGPERGVTPSAVPGPEAAAVRHDGVGSYTYSDRSYAGLQQFTLETWFRTTSSSGGKLIGLGNRVLQNSSTKDNSVYLLDDGRVRFGMYTGAYRLATSERSYNDGEWHHVAASVGPNGMRLYVDGEQVADNFRATAGRNLTGWWRAGGDSLDGWPDRPSSDYFAGDLDELAVYEGELPPSRIAAHHAAASEPTGSVVSVTPTADTYVNAAAAGENYGTHQQLAVRGDSAYESYLRFDLPPPPAGTALTHAALRIRTSGEEHAGSADEFEVVPVVGAWSETTTTYRTRPELAPEPLGSLNAPEAAGATYSAPLDAPTLRAALGDTYDLALVSEGTDSLWLWAREAGQAENRPRLVLTFGVR